MGVNSEYGKLRKVLLCKPDYFKWLPMNETALKYLRLGQSFTREDAQKQHQEFPDAHLHEPVGNYESLINAPSEHSAVSVLSPEEFIQGVGMCIEVDYTYRPVFQNIAFNI